MQGDYYDLLLGFPNYHRQILAVTVKLTKENKMNEKWYKNPEVWMLISFIFVINGFFIFGFMSEMKSAEIQAKYFNEKYGTHYTTHDFYWAGSTIRNYLTEGQQNTQNINIKGVIPVNISN